MPKKEATESDLHADGTGNCNDCGSETQQDELWMFSGVCEYCYELKGEFDFDDDDLPC